MHVACAVLIYVYNIAMIGMLLECMTMLGFLPPLQAKSNCV